MLSSDNPHSPPVTLGTGTDAQPANSSWSPRPLCPRQRGFCRLLCCRPSSSCTPSNCILSFYRYSELRRAFPTDTVFDLLYSYFLSFPALGIHSPWSGWSVFASFIPAPLNCSRIIDDEGLLVWFWPSFCSLLSLSNVQHLTYTHTHTPTNTYPYTHPIPHRYVSIHVLL
jgi:hypothetical protein